MAAVEHHHAAHKLVVVQALAVHLRFDQHRKGVVLRAGAPLRHQIEKVLTHAIGPALRPLYLSECRGSC